MAKKTKHIAPPSGPKAPTTATAVSLPKSKRKWPRKPVDREGYRPEYADRAALACQLGLTDYEIGIVFGVCNKTIMRWRHEHPGFAEALRTGKLMADERVERSLYHKAIGYTYEAEELFQYEGEIIRAKVTKHEPPNTTAMVFWLKNRRPMEWRDVHKHEVGKAGEFDQMTQDELRQSIIDDMKTMNLVPNGDGADVPALPDPQGVANRPVPAKGR